MFKAKEMWAFMSVGADGDEGLIGMKQGDVWLPFVATDGGRLDMLRDLSRKVAVEIKRPIYVVKFTNREEVETIHGEEETE